jgi:hypothetical protein
VALSLNPIFSSSLTLASMLAIILNQIFNIGADKAYEVRYVAELIRQFMHSNQKLEFLPPRNEVKHAFASHEKVKRRI